MSSLVHLGILVAILLATTGCEKEATGQSVAVVNGDEISLSELNAELELANVPDSADKKQVMPQLLQRIVDRRVLAQKAISAGVDRHPDFLTRKRRMEEDLLIGLYTKRQADTIKPPSPAEIQRFIEENPGMFGQRAVLAINQIQFNRPADMTLLRQMENDKSLDAVAATLTRLGIPFIRTTNRLDTASLPSQMLRQIEALPPGEPFVVPAGDKMLANVIVSRESANLSGEDSRRIASEALRRQRLLEAMDEQLKGLRSSADIEYQAGYEPVSPKSAEGAAIRKAASK